MLSGTTLGYKEAINGGSSYDKIEKPMFISDCRWFIDDTVSCHYIGLIL